MWLSGLIGTRFDEVAGTFDADPVFKVVAFDEPGAELAKDTAALVDGLVDVPAGEIMFHSLPGDEANAVCAPESPRVV